MQLTHRWLDRCIKHFNETDPKYGYQQSLFPIVQGCVYPDLRKQSAEYIASKGADGNAIGGLAVGEPTEKMYEMIEVVNEIITQRQAPLSDGSRYTGKYTGGYRTRCRYV